MRDRKSESVTKLYNLTLGINYASKNIKDINTDQDNIKIEKRQLSIKKRKYETRIRFTINKLLRLGLDFEEDKVKKEIINLLGNNDLWF